MKEGDTFSTWEEFSFAFNKYCHENKAQMSVIDSKKVETANKRLEKAQKYPKEHKYKLAKYGCVLYGEHKSTSTGIHHKQP